MKYYTYSGKKSQSRFKSNRKQLIIRITAIVSAVVLSVAFALILGNYLKKKLENAPLSDEPIDSIIDTSSADDGTSGIGFVKNDRSTEELSAVFGCLDLEGCPDAASAERFVISLRDAGYTGIIFNVKRDGGKYAYVSNAVTELSNITSQGGAVSYDILSSAVNSASVRGMRSAAYIDVGDVFTASEDGKVGVTLDRAVVKELSAMGFSEIVFGGLADDCEITTGFVKELYGYFSHLRTECENVDFGLVIDPLVLEDPGKTPALELVFRFIDFFAFDLRDVTAFGDGAIAALLDNFGGSFSAYSILTLTDGGSVETITNTASVFSSKNHLNVAFLTPRHDYSDGSDYSKKINTYSVFNIDNGNGDS
ncbi:MAG: hypothetical protein IJS45_11005 [Clostridia bacterium]|nr:hypothetical protein [Clostridia bacterium]